MPQKLVNKIAVITGAGSEVGVGREVALAMAKEGANVVVNDIGENADGTMAADSVVEKIIKTGGKAIANYDSVATMEGGRNIIQTAVKNFGKVDILVNCAGNFKFQNTTDLSEEEWDSIINVHLKGHFSCCKAALLEMAKQKSGVIINFSSRAAFFQVHNLAYGSAKAGILGLTSMLSKEYKDQGIRINAILPSAITKLFPWDKNPLGDNLPIPLKFEPDYITPLIIFLATEKAQNITGRFFYACGGDICLYNEPFQFPGSHMFIRKDNKWSVDELDELIPTLIA
jgi:3-oxoacyl-[acyl-carrier protein] reductase